MPSPPWRVKPDPVIGQNQHRAGEFNEDAQKRHDRRRRHPGLRHFGDPARKIGDLAEPGGQEDHNQRATRNRPGPWPFKDGSDKFGRAQAIHVWATRRLLFLKHALRIDAREVWREPTGRVAWAADPLQGVPVFGGLPVCIESVDVDSGDARVRWVVG